MRPQAPRIVGIDVVRGFAVLGMFIAHILVREVFRQPEAIATTDDTVVETAVDLFLQGLEYR